MRIPVLTAALIAALAGITVAAPPRAAAESATATRYLRPFSEPKVAVPSVAAASAIVVDVRSGRVLHAKNADAVRPPASTQKLLTALVVIEAGSLDKKVRIQTSDTWAEPTKLYLKAGEVYTRRELLRILLVRSMNDVARALARDVAGSVENFAVLMNRKAAQLGATNSRFVNPNGLPAKGQYSTARDMSRIALAAYAEPAIRSMVSLKSVTWKYADGRTKLFTNTNRVLRNYDFCNGMKTGYTNAAGFCLIASGVNGRREVITVLLGNTRDRIWKDSYSLLAWGLSI